ncbi:sugar porter (SP) family MFS transporter [Propionibacteriaceae bacterium ES.041]|uniref:sugar porter family MFS transporter n=1 Tax=Enemella evansiae TaxID=2016499 RepID=UPI000B97C40C|nr:sugar porter family MFS transporter [Enemella evansiae]OYO03223.1 MFS transporter [Enemella evansiae]PFG65925.1 sugar porter (SP) family MFS transporter [Propionibacteriaceae bacterium ES.041]
MKPLVIRSAIVASLGGLIFGFDTAVISGAEGSIQEVFGLSDGMLGFTVTTALIGTILGALIAGQPADRYGRKKVLYVIGVLYLIGALGSAFAPNVVALQIFRFIGGIGVGASSVCAPIYTAEVSPPKNRGKLVGLVQFNIVLGILVAYASNAIIRALIDGEHAWRWMLGVMAIPSVVFLLLLFTVPETPRWLMAHGRQDEAREVSERLTMTRAESDDQLAEIARSLQDAAHAPSVPFFTKGHMRVIMLAVAIAFFNQMSGINAILYYAPRVMEAAGASTNAAFLMSVGVGAMNLVATMAALTVIDRIGRRSLMIVGSIGYLLSLGFLSGVMFFYERIGFNSTSSVLVLLGLMVFIAAHAFGQGSVIWVFISEIFPNRIRGRGQSLGSLTHWVFAAITSFAFPPIIGALGGGVAFLIFFVAMIGQLIWVLKVMPETKGVPLEEMEARLGVTDDVSTPTREGQQ